LEVVTVNVAQCETACHCQRCTVRRIMFLFAFMTRGVRRIERRLAVMPAPTRDLSENVELQKDAAEFNKFRCN